MKVARPSKQFFHKYFVKDMLNTDGKECAADISCAYFKNYTRFKSKSYLGVDINEDVLNRLPEQKEGMPELTVEICDILKLDLPEKYKIDFIVSTHTFSFVDVNERLRVLGSFVSLLQPGGDLLFNIPAHSSYISDIDKLLAGSFRSLKKIQYRNPVCAWYENQLIDGHGVYQQASGWFLKLVNRLMYFLEASRILSFSGNMVYYYCEEKH